MKRGFQRLKIDGQFYEITEAPVLDKKVKHDIEVVVDRIAVRPDMAARLAESFETALELAEGTAFIEYADEKQDGKLKQTYKADKLHDLKNLPRPRHELLKLNKYLFKAVPIQASRGCPYRCSFCEIPVFYQGSYRTRPVADIVEEIRQVMQVTGFRRFQFIDDQITGKHKFAKELFRALEPLKESPQ